MMRQQSSIPKTQTYQVLQVCMSTNHSRNDKMANSKQKKLMTVINTHMYFQYQNLQTLSRASSYLI